MPLMAEERSDVPTTSAPPKSPEKKKPIGVPMDTFVKFGTTTMAHDKFMAKRKAEEDARRAADDREKRDAREHGLQAGNPGSIASRYTFGFTDNPGVQKAYVPLEYVTRTGREVTHRGRADIIMVQDPAFEGELMLMLFCPMCIEKRGLDPAHAITHVRQSNRKWELDQRGAGELVVDEDGEAYRTAGVVRDGERFTCPRCSWQARVDNNKVWPD